MLVFRTYHLNISAYPLELAKPHEMTAADFTDRYPFESRYLNAALRLRARNDWRLKGVSRLTLPFLQECALWSFTFAGAAIERDVEISMFWTKSIPTIVDFTDACFASAIAASGGALDLDDANTRAYFATYFATSARRRANELLMSHVRDIERPPQVEEAEWLDWLEGADVEMATTDQGTRFPILR
jgi:hypothetical protein